VVHQRDPVPHQPKVGICGETGRHRFRHVMDCLIWCTELQARTKKKAEIHFMVDLPRRIGGV